MACDTRVWRHAVRLPRIRRGKRPETIQLGKAWWVPKVAGKEVLRFYKRGDGRRPTSAICFFPFPELFDRIEADDLLPARTLRARFARQGSEFLGDSQTFCRSPGAVPFEPLETGGFEWV